MRNINLFLTGLDPDWQFLAAIVQKAAFWAKSQNEKKHKVLGGVVAIRDVGSLEGKTVCFELGNLPTNSDNVKCHTSAGEQILRLMDNGSCRSLDSANFDWGVQRYAGGVKIGNYLVAFTGFNLEEDWRLNEAVSVSIGAYLLIRDKGHDIGETEKEITEFYAAGLEEVCNFIDKAGVTNNPLIKEFCGEVFGLKK